MESSVEQKRTAIRELSLFAARILLAIIGTPHFSTFHTYTTPDGMRIIHFMIPEKRYEEYLALLEHFVDE